MTDRIDHAAEALRVIMTLPSGEAVSLEGHADKYRDSLTTGAGAFVAWNPSDATLIVQ